MNACLEALTIILINLRMSADHLNVWDREREREEGDEFAVAAAPSLALGSRLSVSGPPWGNLGLYEGRSCS
jgi:hypothetical protein